MRRRDRPAASRRGERSLVGAAPAAPPRPPGCPSRHRSGGIAGIPHTARETRIPTGRRRVRWTAGGGCSPCLQERVNPRELLRPEPVEPSEVPLLDALGEASIVHAGEPMAWVAQKTLQHRIVDLGHDMFVEEGLVPAIEDRVWYPPAQQAANQALGAQVRALELGGETEKEL